MMYTYGSVYVVMWYDESDCWFLDKAFVNKDDADAYIKSKPNSYDYSMNVLEVIGGG